MTLDGRADRLGIFRKFERKYYDLFKKGTIMSEKEQEKYKITVRMNEKTKAEIDEMMGDAHTGSVNAFINKAIEFYIGYLKQGKNLNYISPILASAVKSEIKNVERNFSEMIFKTAVQISMLTQLVADEKEFEDDYLDKLYNWCAQRVASTNGIIDLNSLSDRKNRYTSLDYFKDSGGRF